MSAPKSPSHCDGAMLVPHKLKTLQFTCEPTGPLQQYAYYEFNQADKPTSRLARFIARVFTFASCGTVIGPPAGFVKNLPKIKSNF